MSRLLARILAATGVAALLLLLMPTGEVTASDGDEHDARFVVTITNITQGQIFTPIVAASHTAPLKLALAGSPAVLDTADSGAPLPPGASVRLMLKTRGAFRFVSLAAMLVPTNDAFFALNGVEGPRGREVVTRYSPAYDAGTEMNDELCTQIPGPPAVCQGEGANPNRGAGNFVHIHPGIHGDGDLLRSRYDWRNPVARITIQRAN